MDDDPAPPDPVIADAVLVLRSFTAAELAGHTQLPDRLIGRFLDRHARWFDMAPSPDPGPADLATWTLRGEHVADVEALADTAPDDPDTGDRGEPDWLALCDELLQEARDTPETDAADRLRTTAALYFDRVEATYWRRQVETHDGSAREAVRLAQVGRDLAERPLDPPGDAERRAALLAHASLAEALGDWTRDFTAELAAVPLPAAAWPDSRRDDDVVRWVLKDIGFSAPLFLPAIRAAAARSILGADRWAPVRPLVLAHVQQVLRLPAAAHALPAASLLAVALAASDLADALLSALLAHPALAADARGTVCESLARLALADLDSGSAAVPAATACQFLIQRGCPDAEFFRLAPGALLGGAREGSARLVHAVVERARVARPSLRSFGVALFSGHVGGDAAVAEATGRALVERVDLGTGSLFLEALRLDDVATLIDTQDVFCLVPGDAIAERLRGMHPARLPLPVAQGSRAADTLSALVTSQQWQPRRPERSGGGLFTGALHRRHAHAGPAGFTGAGHD